MAKGRPIPEQMRLETLIQTQTQIPHTPILKYRLTPLPLVTSI